MQIHHLFEKLDKEDEELCRSEKETVGSVGEIVDNYNIIYESAKEGDHFKNFAGYWHTLL